MLNASSFRRRLARSLPFYYGWVIAADTVTVSLTARTVMAVATLSVFVVPMTEELGWSRGLFSGAVSLGGLCAVAISPLVGRSIDRYGTGLLIAGSSLLTGVFRHRAGTNLGALGLLFPVHTRPHDIHRLNGAGITHRHQQLVCPSPPPGTGGGCRRQGGRAGYHTAGSPTDNWGMELAHCLVLPGNSLPGSGGFCPRWC